MSTRDLQDLGPERGTQTCALYPLVSAEVWYMSSAFPPPPAPASWPLTPLSTDPSWPLLLRKLDTLSFWALTLSFACHSLSRDPLPPEGKVQPQTLPLVK